MTFKVAAFDMDGTILNNDHVLSQRTINALRALTTKAIVVIATGRSVPSIIGYLRELQLNQDVYCVAYNGTGVHKYNRDSDEMEYVHSFPLQPTQVKLLMGLAQLTNNVLQCYNPMTGEVFVKTINDEQNALCERYASLVGRQQTRINDYEEVIGLASAKCLIMTNDPDALIEKAKEILPPDFHIIKGSPYPFFVEFLPKDVSKATGLEKICEYLNVTMDDVVSFGDGDNDIEMLKQSGVGYAMFNANDNVKLNADKVTEKSNNDDGVAIEIEKLFDII